MRRKIMFTILVVCLMAFPALVGKAAPMGTGFTYQGRLMDANIPADGLHDFQFKLFDDPYKGTQLGTTIDVNHIDVIDGYFTVEVDFGNKVFNGDASWLEIGVRPGYSMGRFTVLSPRQQVSPSPYAIHAKGATDADTVDGYDAGNASGHIAVSNGNTCTNLNADKLDGFHSTAFATNNHNHDSLYINETGDTMRADANGWLLTVDNTGMGGAIDASSVGIQSIGLRGTSHGNNGVGVRGNALGDDGYGVFGYAASTSGRGVYGMATGDLGYGVYGYASADGAIASNYGGYFQADGAYGHGVYAKVEGANSWAVQGYATATGDIVNYGGYFESYGDKGYGIYGKSAGREGYGVFGVSTYEGLNTNYGGYFIAYGRYGRGVYGESTGGEGYGVYGVASGGEAAGVYGYASKKGDWNNPGGRFVSWGNYASGVVGSGFGSNSRGVSGIAGNYPDSTNYGGHFQATGTTGIAVYGWARNNADAQNYGGQFIAEGTSGIGVYGEAEGVNGMGVVGVGGKYDFYANGPGVNYGASSSVRWKRNIRPIDQSLDKIIQLQGIYFDWDAEHGGGHDVGMIAEEVGQVLPEIVQYEENGIDATGMDYSKLTPLLVEAVKELKAENESLKKRLDAVERTIRQNQPVNTM
jgi:hypothetical protein